MNYEIVVPDLYKAKAVPLHATKALEGEDVYLLLFLELYTRWGASAQSHAPAALYPRRKDPPVSIVQEAGWVPEPV
jgi:hypothetical protein